MADETVACDRLFYSLPKSNLSVDKIEKKSNPKPSDLLHYISENVIGLRKVFSGPYGLRKELYLDYTASGKSVKFIEDYILNEVLTEYGNTHTTTSVSSLQTTLFRHEARDIIRNAVNASEHDAVIFVGSGTTGAIHKLIHSLDLKHRPVVFVGPYEHHSNLLPWIETGAKVIRVTSDDRGLVDLQHLQKLLQKWKSTGRQLIGCFSASSNVTGVLVDVDAINICLHKHGALAFWDYATAAPYVKVDMNPLSTSGDQDYLYKDAVFLSPHKFIGGVQTPGVLIAKKSLFRNRVPDGSGGGSVFFVRREGHRYLQEPELKEEGGTPAIVEAVRAGLVFQLKQNVTPELILQREQYLLQKAKAAWQDISSLVILGNLDVERLPIFSFLVYHQQSGRYLHHNYISALLNDLFGIQARGGCACAGPYAMDLLGMEEAVSKKIENLLAEDSRLDRTHLRRYKEYSPREIIRPGFTRINLPYFMDDDTLEFVLKAVRLVAEEGWKLLPQYMFNPETGEWRQVNFQVFKDRKWLGHISYKSGEMMYKVPPPVVKGPLPESYQDCLQKARDLFTEASKSRYQLADHTMMFDEAVKPFRWFVLPSEAAECLRNQYTQNLPAIPFCPPHHRESLGLPVFIGSHDNGDCDITNFILRSDRESLCSCNCDGRKNYDVENTSGKLENKCEQNQTSGQSKEVHVSETLPSGSSLLEETGKSFKQPSGSCESDSACSNVESTKDIVNEFNILSHDEKNKQLPFESSEICDKQTPCNSECNMTLKQDATNCDRANKSLKLNDRNESSTSVLSCEEAIDKAVSTNIDNNETDKKTDFEENSELRNERMICSRDKETRKRKNSGDDNQKEEIVKRSKDKAETGEKEVKGKRKDNKWFSPPKTIFAPFLKALEEYNMICDGDKILICLSGGKDSLSLLHTIRQYQFYARKKRISFEFGAVTVDPETPSYDPSPLKQYLASLGVPYFYESQGILEQATNLPYECASICSFCSRMKRGRIYACARREGYNVIALGQHLDDLCESFLMSIFHNGLLRTMKSCYTVEEGDLRVIRPLVYAREKDLRSFAEKNKLPVIAENCPACFEAPKERHRTKQLLAAQEILFPQIFNSLMSAIKPIMAINKTGVKITDFLQQDPAQDDIDI